MQTFTGIYNIKGKEIKIYAQIDFNELETSAFYFDGKKFDVDLRNNEFELNGTRFTYVVKNYQDEIILAAKEKVKVYCCIFSTLLHKPKYFVITNKL